MVILLKAVDSLTESVLAFLKRGRVSLMKEARRPKASLLASSSFWLYPTWKPGGYGLVFTSPRHGFGDVFWVFDWVFLPRTTYSLGRGLSPTVARDNSGRAIGYTVARDNGGQHLGLTIAGGTAPTLN